MRVLASGPNYYIRATSFKNERLFYQNNHRQMNYVLEQISKISGKRTSELIKHSRLAELVEWRMIFTYICRQQGYGSFKEIGVILDNRHHASIIHAYRMACNFIDAKDVDFIVKLNAVKHLLK